MESELGERVAVLENQSSSLERVLKDIQAKVDSLHDEMTRYKGFLGAITFVGSGVVIAIGLFKDYLLRHWN